MDEGHKEFRPGDGPGCTPRHNPREYLIVKEPDGAIGAPLLMKALPESRMVLLIRDPRDVAASALDAMKKGGWRYERRNWGTAERPVPADERPNFARKHASGYLRHIGNARKAYEAHEGPKTLVRNEDLKADTSRTMRHLCSGLGLPFGEERLARIVEKHAWENVPEEGKGPGMFYRKAISGGWREDLTPEQVRTIEEITAPLLEEFYP